MPPDDDFTRAHDPVRRRNAVVAGSLVAACVVGVALGLLLSRPGSQPAGTVGATASATPAVVTPLTAIPSPVPAQPVVGASYSVADDPAARQLVVFGGIDSYDTTWLWDGRRWTLTRPRVSPPGRFNATIAYDPLTRVVMLYGGRLGPGQVVDDTWAWDGRTWRELDAGTGSPPAGEGSVMAWDDALNEMVLVNGEAGVGQAGQAGGGQTWIWNGAHWVRQLSGDLPSGTFFVGLVADPMTGGLLAAGCCSTPGGSSSTWAWDASGWRQLATHTKPAFTAALAREPAGNSILLFADAALAPGREVWSWSGRDWTLLSGARLPVFPEAAVTDVSEGRIVILGSFTEPVQGMPQPVHLWSWNGSTWQQRG